MATSHSDTAFLTIEKSMTFRGAREHWVNVYHVDTVPPGNADWDALANAVWSLETACFDIDVQLERIEGHNPGTPPLLAFEKDVAPPGEGGIGGIYVPAGGHIRAPGDVAISQRYGTTQKNKLGKPIYLRNYYHAIWLYATHDAMAPTQITAFNALGQGWVNGIAANGLTYRRAGPRGAVAQNHALGQWTTTRTLKARGKRHKTVVKETKYVPVPIGFPLEIP